MNTRLANLYRCFVFVGVLAWGSLHAAPTIELRTFTAKSFAAIAKAHETLRHISWFTVSETRGQVVDGKVAHWQVSLKIGFTLE